MQILTLKHANHNNLVISVIHVAEHNFIASSKNKWISKRANYCKKSEQLPIICQLLVNNNFWPTNYVQTVNWQTEISMKNSVEWQLAVLGELLVPCWLLVCKFHVDYGINWSMIWCPGHGLWSTSPFGIAILFGWLGSFLFLFFLLLVVYNCIFSSCHKVWKGGPNPAFRPLFWENPASRTFFVSFPNPAFLSQKITLKGPISSKANKINARCTGRLILLIDILNLQVFLKASQKEILAFCTSVWIELASLFAISRPI